MGFFNSVNENDTIRVFTDDGEDWIELKAQLTKRDMNKVLKFAPRNADDTTTEAQLAFIENFGLIVTVGWSKVDSKGEPVEFDKKQFLDLDSRSAAWIEKTWSTHLTKLVGADVEDLEGKLEI